MAFNANGDIFVADGYCNRRVMQYTADGTFIRSYTMANVRISNSTGMTTSAQAGTARTVCALCIKFGGA